MIKKIFEPWKFIFNWQSWKETYALNGWKSIGTRLIQFPGLLTAWYFYFMWKK